MTTTELTPCEQLAQTLSAYQQSATDLEAYRDKAERAQADEDAALTSEVYSEHEIATRMGRAQNLKTVYATRIAHKEKATASQVAALEAAYPLATIEFIGQLNTELAKRQAIVTERLVQALGADETMLATHEIFEIPQHTGALCEYAGTVRAIAQLRPGSYFGRPGDSVAIINAATALLDAVEKFKLEISNDERHN